MKKKLLNLNMSVANDNGNGFSKTFCQFSDGSHSITVTPSLCTQIFASDKLNYASFDVEHITDNMDVVIESPALKHKAEYLVGKAAMISGNIATDYNIESNEGKATPDISIIIPFTKLAYEALKYCFKKEKCFPSTLNVSVSNYFTCLPINEFKNPKNKETLINKLSHGKHTITVKNLGKDIKVNIRLNSKNIKVFPEGAVAQVGLIYNPDVKSAYRQGNLFKNSSFKDGKAYSRSGNVLIIDIGDGSTDISVMNGTRPVAGTSLSLNQGVGTAATVAASKLAIDYPKLGNYSRAIFLNKANKNNNEGKVLKDKYLGPQIDLLIQKIGKSVENIYTKMNNDIDTIVVLGGGVNLLSSKQKKSFQHLINQFNPLQSSQDIWFVLPKYSQLLNLDGLRIYLMYSKND